MKKMISLFLVFVLCLSLCACGKNGGATEAPETEPMETLSAREQLTEVEQRLYEALIRMTTADFYEPSAVRVLEIGDYNENTAMDETSFLYGPDTVVVRLQGENGEGGTLNHYYLVCIKGAENMTETAQITIKTWTMIGEMANVLKHKGEAGDYAQLPDSYSFEKDAADLFDIGRINKALSEYWAEMGF